MSSQSLLFQATYVISIHVSQWHIQNLKQGGAKANRVQNSNPRPQNVDRAPH